MKKLRLDLDDLVVQSFITGGDNRRGTVKGHDSTTDCGVTDSNDAYCIGTLNPGPQGCPPTYIPQPCGTNAPGCHNLSLEYPTICGEISWPDCSAKCTNMAGCTTVEMGC